MTSSITPNTTFRQTLQAFQDGFPEPIGRAVFHFLVLLLLCLRSKLLVCFLDEIPRCQHCLEHTPVISSTRTTNSTER